MVITDTAPFIDRLAASGVRYQWARSASPWTLPAHTTMFTGQLPATHHIVDDSVSLSTSEPVLPALLQSAGYTTGDLSQRSMFPVFLVLNVALITLKTLACTLKKEPLG